MSNIFTGRYTAGTDEPFVVFLIGMRFNKWRAVRQWLPVFMAMPKMIRELEAHPEKGFLGGRLLLEWRGATNIQYWRSFEALEQFARNPDDPHLPAWKAFYKNVKDGSVGFWHETYVVRPGLFETIYNNTPRMGLASVMDHVPATGGRREARERLKIGSAVTLEEVKPRINTN
ncbi:MAG: DUF4188 domain-containing protein [Candidatus Promineifilaceae bacterium]